MRSNKVVPRESYKNSYYYGNYKLRKAILEENIEEVRKLITKKSNLDAPRRRGISYKNHIQAAASTGNVEIVKLLIDKGALRDTEDYEDVLKIAADYNHVELVKFLTQAELKQVNEKSINKFIDEIIHGINPANRAVLDFLHSHRAKKQWGKVTHIHNKYTTTKRDLREKSCEIPYYSLLGKQQEHIDTTLLEKHKRLFSTKSFSPSISKYGGICDIRPQIPEKTIMQKYPNFMKIVDDEGFSNFTNINDNKWSGIPKSIMLPYLVDSNIVLNKEFDILNLVCNFSSSARFKFVHIPTFKGPIKQKFQNFSKSEGVADYDADLSVDIGNGDKKKLYFLACII